MDEIPFARRLERIRLLRGYSQRGLAKRAGVSPAAVSRYESGLRKPTGLNLRKLAIALDVSIGDLAGGEGVPGTANGAALEVESLAARLEQVERTLGSLTESVPASARPLSDAATFGGPRPRTEVPSGSYEILTDPAPDHGIIGAVPESQPGRAAWRYDIRSPADICTLADGGGRQMHINLMLAPAALFRHPDTRVVLLRLHIPCFPTVAREGETLIFEQIKQPRKGDRLAVCVAGVPLVGTVRENCRGLVLKHGGVDVTTPLSDERLTVIGLYQGRYHGPDEDESGWE